MNNTNTEIDLDIAREYVSQCASPVSPIARAVAEAIEHGRKWNWEEAELALNKAYQLAGSTNTFSGYAWHNGEHPLQAAIALAEKEYGLNDD